MASVAVDVKRHATSRTAKWLLRIPICLCLSIRRTDREKVGRETEKGKEIAYSVEKLCSLGLRPDLIHDAETKEAQHKRSKATKG